MSWEVILIVVIIVGALISFAMEKIPVDQTALTAFVVLLLAGLLPFNNTLPLPSEFFSVLSNPAPLTIAAMFIISAALDKCGIIDKLAAHLGELTKLGYLKFVFLMMFGVAGISAFINNTPVVVVFLPIIISLSRKLNVPASKLLIPLSYASIAGGLCTLVGTSTNILASGMIQEAGLPPIRMFELAWIGLPLLIISVVYMTFIGSKILPRRESLTSILSDEERKEYFTEAFIQKGSEVAGKTLKESGLLGQRSIRIIEILRNGALLQEDLKTVILREGDQLVLACRPSGFAQARTIEGIKLNLEQQIGLETIAAHEGAIVEGMIGPRSSIAGQSLKQLNFRQRYRMITLAVHRRGINLRENFENISLEFGDTLLLMGTDRAIEELRRNDDVLLLDRPRTPSMGLEKKVPVVLLTIIAVIAAASANILPISVAALTGCAVLFATGCIKPKDGYNSIEWSIIILIYCMLGVGLAMERTGTSDIIANSMVAGVETFFSDEMKPFILLATVYLLTALFTELLSNNATIVLMLPIALGLGHSLQLDPRPFVIATCIASSASFSTPIGYQTNTYVYGVGGYKFTDFFKVGFPLNLIYFFSTVCLVPLIWEF